MALRSGEVTPGQIEQQKKTEELQKVVNGMSTRDFLIRRTKETIMVPICGLGGSKDVEIRARLSKSEIREYQGTLARWKIAQESESQFIETEEEETDLARFLEYITIDATLTAKFWLSEDLAPELVDNILTAYFVLEPAQRLADISRFLGERLRSRSSTDVAGVESHS